MVCPFAALTRAPGIKPPHIIRWWFCNDRCINYQPMLGGYDYFMGMNLGYQPGYPTTGGSQQSSLWLLEPEWAWALKVIYPAGWCKTLPAYTSLEMATPKYMVFPSFPQISPIIRGLFCCNFLLKSLLIEDMTCSTSRTQQVWGRGVSGYAHEVDVK